jgi:dihydroorotase
MTSELLQQVRVLDPASQRDQVADVLIVEGRIQAIEERIADPPAQTQIRNCQGWVLGPGLVDLYSHSGEPGFEARETFASLSQAAAAGGFTRLAVLPDMVPTLDHPGGLELLRSRLSDQIPLHLHAWGALTQGLQGQQMAELAELATAGVVGFSDGYPLQNLALIRRLLEYLKPWEKPIAIWPCDRELSGHGVIREGMTSIRLGLPGSPAIAETTALVALLEIVAATQTPVHIMRVSTARSVELIQIAKGQGLPITASTTWMHLLLNQEAVSTYDPNLRLEPPLGSPTDQKALIEGVRTGVLEAIAIDHTPCTYEEKTVAFAEAPPGAIGLELALPLLWQAFVTTHEWTALDLWGSLSTRPALCLQQQPATITLGQPAELTLFDPQQEWKVEQASLKSLSRNTPWLEQKLIGQTVQTWYAKA